MTCDILAAAAKHGPDAVDYARYNLWATLGGVILLAIYTAVTAWQAMLTRAALAETRRSNDATKKSNELAKRAWLVVNLKARSDVDIVARRITEAVELTNLGGVPATNAEAWGRFDLWADPPEIPDSIVPREGQPAVTGLIVGPGKPHELLVHKWDIDLSDADWKRIDKNEAVYVFYCEVMYRDIFDNPRKTVACFQYSPWGGWQDRREHWAYAPKHNKLT